MSSETRIIRPATPEHSHSIAMLMREGVSDVCVELRSWEVYTSYSSGCSVAEGATHHLLTKLATRNSDERILYEGVEKGDLSSNSKYTRLTSGSSIVISIWTCM